MTHTCSRCGGVSVEHRAEFSFQHGGATLTFEDRQSRCGQCDTVTYKGDQISEHELAVANAIRRHEGLLTPQELRNIRVKYRMLQTDMEQMLNTGPKTWTRWERGKVTPSKSTDNLLRIFASDPSVALWMMRKAGVENADAKAEIERAAKTADQNARKVVVERLGVLPAGADAVFVERVTEIALLVSREGLCSSLQSPEYTEQERAA